MNFQPGDIVRRVSANVSSTVSSVSSTVSSVAQVAGVRRRENRLSSDTHDHLLANSKEKLNITVKCSPNKDAWTISTLSIKSGYLMKRNEQGVYHSKFVCTVPHMFLYYFDTDKSEAPRGVIDLQLYDNISKEGNQLKLANSEEDRIRQFYFEDPDDDNLNDWLTSLIRDRYQAVCDERDAYQHMQFEMTGVIDTAMINCKKLEQDKDVLLKELQLSLDAYTQSFSALQEALVVIGITEEEMLKLSDIGKVGNALKMGISQLNTSHEHQLQEMNQGIESLKNSHKEEIEKLKEELINEKEKNVKIEEQMNKLKSENETSLQNINHEMNNTMLNFQVVVAAKTAAESKANTLVEQKKVLVKEVKTLRNKIEFNEDTVTQLKTINTDLINTIASLQEQIKSFSQQLEQNNHHKSFHTNPVSSPKIVNLAGATVPDDGVAANEEVNPPPEKTDTESKNGLLTTEKQETPTESSDNGKPPTAMETNTTTSEDVEKLLQKNQTLLKNLNSTNDAAKTSPEADGRNSITQKLANNVKGLFRQPAPNKVSGAESVHSDTTFNHELTYNQFQQPEEFEFSEARISWEMPPTELKELGWLTPEQTKIVETRMLLKEELNTPETQRRSTDVSELSQPPRHSSMSIFGNSKPLLGYPSFGESSGGSSLLDEDGNHHSPSASSLNIFSSIFNKDKPAESNISSPVLHSVEGESRSVTGESDKEFDFKSPVSDKEQGPVAMQLQCLRCGGTVEGPKNSTCRCKVPALMPEDLHSNTTETAKKTLTSLGSAFRRGSVAAGGLVGGVASGFGGLMHFSHLGHVESTTGIGPRLSDDSGASDYEHLKGKSVLEHAASHNYGSG